MKHIKLASVVLLFLLLPLSIYSQIDYYKILIPTRDGKELAADLYTLDLNFPKPVILIQTPYNKNSYRTGFPSSAAPMPFNLEHYNYVVVDWRGFYGSDSAAVPFYDRGLDGYDCIEWIAQQAWCNDKVGTFGGSALGLIQFQTARHKPPHLVCAMPMIKDFKTKYSDFYYGGVLRKEHVESIERLRFIDMDLITAHPAQDDFWDLTESANNYPDQIAVPMLMVTGWFDHYPTDVIRAYNDIVTKSDQAVRNKHKLIVGPWLHGEIGAEQQGGLEFPEAVGITDTAASQFFDFYLRGKTNGYELIPAVRYFVMGSNVWENASTWTDVGISEMYFYLYPDGFLRKEIYSGASSHGYIYDPKNPSPTFGGSRFNPFNPTILLGPRDQRFYVESRNDVLIFSTEELTSPIEILGPVAINLYVSSNRTDTDFSVRLCDVYPDGRSMLITQGIKRMRFRNSYSDPELITPGQIYKVTVELCDLAIKILPQHKLRLIISSSNYPMFDINLNNGGPMYIMGDTLVANNIVYFSSEYASNITWKTSPGTDIKLPDQTIPYGFQLSQNYPNPFNPTTTIEYTIPTLPSVSHLTKGRDMGGVVTLKVYDLLGREAATLVNEYKQPGKYKVEFNVETFHGTSLPSGVYFYRLQAGTFSDVKKFILMK
ncbi:MAG: CocE/NonD family hydrolase [Bacteroidota bacterium]